MYTHRLKRVLDLAWRNYFCDKRAKATGMKTRFIFWVMAFLGAWLALGQVEFKGSTQNNILANGIKGASGVFLDPHAPPAERAPATAQGTRACAAVCSAARRTPPA